MKKKNIIKSVLFFVIFIILFYIVCKLLWLIPTSISYFYKEPENSLDIVYIGSSNVYRIFNNVLAYEQFGYTVGILSSSNQPFSVAKNLIIESEKYQKPYIYIIDIGQVANDLDFLEAGNEIRVTTDSMKFSKNRIDTINYALSYDSKIDKKEYISYYFSFLMYHNSWKSIGKIKSNIVGIDDCYKGYFSERYQYDIKAQEKYNWTEDIMNLQEENKQMLLDIINYIKENNLNVLFVVPKKIMDEIHQKKINDAARILQENEFKVINCNNIEYLNDNIDFNTDFYDYGHLNVYGSTKYTLWFSKYLKENYELPNHKNDENYSSWDSEYKRFKENFQKITDKNFDKLLLEYGY